MSRASSLELTQKQMPIVSIVIATRNRPQKLERLLHCIQQQQFSDYECIVVDDASSQETQAQYQKMWQTLGSRFVLHLREHPGGPSQGRNTGILAAKGEYIAFCDDDDYWTRADHLDVAVRALKQEAADFFFANMQTSIDGEIINADWFKVLTDSVHQAIGNEPDVHLISKEQLAFFLKHRIHHANTMVVSRALLLEMGLYWEKVSFAEDHDLSFRLSDTARRVLFRKTVTADLDVSPHPSIARTYSEQDRKLFSILAVLHAEATVKSPLLRKVARKNRAWRLLELAEYAEKEGVISASCDFAVQSFMLAPSLTALKMVLTLFWRRVRSAPAM